MDTRAIRPGRQNKCMRPSAIVGPCPCFLWSMLVNGCLEILAKRARQTRFQLVHNPDHGSRAQRANPSSPPNLNCEVNACYRKPMAAAATPKSTRSPHPGRALSRFGRRRRQCGAPGALLRKDAQLHPSMSQPEQRPLAVLTLVFLSVLWRYGGCASMLSDSVHCCASLSPTGILIKGLYIIISWDAIADHGLVAGCCKGAINKGGGAPKRVSAATGVRPPALGCRKPALVMSSGDSLATPTQSLRKASRVAPF